MSISLHELKPPVGARTKKFRVGRGLGSGRGKTAGRGTKGQRSRTGGRKNLKLKGLKQMLLAFPKTRGFRSRTAKPITIRLERLETFADGSVVNLVALQQAGLLVRQNTKAKIVGNGKLSKRLNVEGIATSAQARAAIEQAGGKVVTDKAV